jgi:2-polyprenyl-3-methyl-5-hydroxy-6-metoxy-1,4-benzoquinol methylase
VLEIGCGEGHLLKSVEPLVRQAIGLDLNRDAAARKVTACEIRAETIEDFAPSATARFDLVCAYQVLEHIVDPASCLRSCCA